MNQVKAARRAGYASPLREQQAAATRRAVLEAARALFLEQGYVVTTMDQIAARAGVSKPTVFSSVGSKRAVLAAVRDVAVAGDDEPVPVRDRPQARRILDETDQRAALRLLARHVTTVVGRSAPVDEVLRVAALGGDPELRRLLDEVEAQRLEGARIWVRALAGKGPLALPERQAVDVLWLHMSPDPYQRLVGSRGWSPSRYAGWLEQALTAVLLQP